MKVLSLKQPWAELILQGKKKIELRKWNTNFRGEFLIHASKVPNKNNMVKFGFKELPLGCLVGKAKLIDVKKYKDEKEFLKDGDLHLTTIGWVQHGFILGDVKRINPIPVKGNLGFWEFKIK